jgi:hypothetical protein
MPLKAIVLLILLALTPRPAIAQSSGVPHGVVFGDVGFARTWDDEGLLGSGASLSGGVGVRLTPRLTIQALVERIPYHRDVEWLTFDGRVLFAGVEAALQSSAPRVRPFVTAGVGLFDDDGVWIQKTIVDPRQPRIEARIDRSYTLSAMTASGGIDFAVSPRTSIRASVRFHGLLDTGDDLAPHVIIQPGIGLAWRW